LLQWALYYNGSRGVNWGVRLLNYLKLYPSNPSNLTKGANKFNYLGLVGRFRSPLLYPTELQARKGNL